MKPDLSIIICAHNPRRAYLDKVLAALLSQTLPLEQWELLLVDNQSDKVLSEEIDLSWHPLARHVREDQLGLTVARLRGIQEAQAETLVFVDDDNVLDADYLEVALHISKDYPFIGSWGGQIRPEFETPPPDWTRAYWDLLALRQFDRDRWSNDFYGNPALPCGAGLCVRECVARKYAGVTRKESKRLQLGRKGSSFSSCEDSDLALTACDIGLGAGSFINLKLTHLLPAHRLQEDYLLKLVEGIARSSTILRFLREGTLPAQKSRSEKLFEAYRLMRISKRDLRFHQARARGIATALEQIRTLETTR
ncbi:glycosyltransferase family 2 protein [Cyanobacteria bacterium FACHB-DQ100]|nr:glycosyltransferase family 2 protein [Cyanobacteria bacterium FACHB-DQ100]